MSRQSFYNNYIQLIRSLDHAEENHLVVPALVLVYSAIDSVSWLAAPGSKDSGKYFRNWVEKWLLRDPRIKCNAEELYAARCGLVHTLTPTSSMTQKGVRKIAYSWGSGNNALLDSALKMGQLESQIVSVHLSDLIEAFRNGMADYMEYVDRDPTLTAAFEKKCEEHFAFIVTNDGLPSNESKGD